MDIQTFIITVLSIVASPTAALVGIYLTYRANNSIKQRDAEQRRLVEFYVKFQRFIVERSDIAPTQAGFLTATTARTLLDLLFDNLHNMGPESQTLVMDFYQAYQTDQGTSPSSDPWAAQLPRTDDVLDKLAKQIVTEHKEISRSLKLPEQPDYI